MSLSFQAQLHRPSARWAELRLTLRARRYFSTGGSGSGPSSVSSNTCGLGTAVS